MRANDEHRRVRTWRKLTSVAAAAALTLSVVGSGTATAANSRILYVGTNLVDSTGAIVDTVTNSSGLPPADGIPDNAGPNPGTDGNVGKLLPTRVSAGYSTAIPIQILNADNQTIAHINLSFPIPGTLLASGLTITDIGGTDQASCSKVSDLTTSAVVGVGCNFDNLRAGALRSFFVVVAVSASFATATTNLFGVQATTNNENGSNLQIFPASSGGFKVLAPDPNALNTFVSDSQPNSSIHTDDVGSANKLATKLDFTKSTGGNLVTIAEDNTTATNFLYKCPDGLTCQVPETTISIQDGLSGSSTQFASPFLTITLTALVPKTYTLSKAFVAHYGPDWILYWGTKSTRCGTDVGAKLAATDQCFNSATLSRPNPDGTQTLVLTVTAKHNGGMRF